MGSLSSGKDAESQQLPRSSHIFLLEMRYGDCRSAHTQYIKGLIVNHDTLIVIAGRIDK